MNVITWLVFEFAYYDVAVQHVSFSAEGIHCLRQMSYKLLKEYKLHNIYILFARFIKKEYFISVIEIR